MFPFAPRALAHSRSRRRRRRQPEKTPAPTTEKQTKKTTFRPNSLVSLLECPFLCLLFSPSTSRPRLAEEVNDAPRAQAKRKKTSKKETNPRRWRRHKRTRCASSRQRHTSPCSAPSRPLSSTGYDKKGIERKDRRFELDIAKEKKFSSPSPQATIGLFFLTAGNHAFLFLS